LAARRIFVSMDLEADEVRYTVRDQGKGFDVAKTLDRLAEPSPSSPCGRGLFFLRQFMDEFRYSEGGRLLYLSKKLKPLPAEARSFGEGPFREAEAD
jgi:anti-sigma regulatory factor (Ser/Thr protein kinase)